MENDSWGLSVVSASSSASLSFFFLSSLYTSATCFGVPSITLSIHMGGKGHDNEQRTDLEERH